jgi:hypothetical protein
MIIEVFWANEKQEVVIMRFNQDWTIEELQSAIQKIRDFSADVDRRIHVILDASQRQEFPPNELLRENVMKELLFQIPTLPVKYFLLVGGSPAGRAVVELISRRFKDLSRNFAFVNTLEEAYLKIEVLKERDAKKNVKRPF